MNVLYVTSNVNNNEFIIVNDSDMTSKKPKWYKLWQLIG